MPNYGAPQAPYGQPQQPAPPYGGQQPPAYGYPQQQPQQPYPPQQPFPQQQQGQPGYGYQPPAPPKRGNGLLIGLVIGVLVLGGGAAAWALSGDDSPGGGGGTTAGSGIGGKYKVVAADTVPGGYTKKSSSDRGAVSGAEGLATLEASTGAVYQKSPAELLILGGSWGTVKDPDALITLGVGQAVKGSGDEKLTWKKEPTAVDAKDPKDPGGKLRCGVATSGKADIPVCIWANHATFGTVSFVNTLPTGGTSLLTQAQAADRARQVRDAVVVAK
ncbi:hypothetical protein ACGFX4_33135 [Kitasatospora sp. NPDC048365]|uniref:hypothetical protein n=1 Tax=Kitasatospora sp. NPDC048365 TaxID=3364050 RepID=UPI00371C4DEA